MTIIKYDDKVQSALLSVVRDILKDASEYGLPGDHHFYITFKTRDPGVKIPALLQERYEDEMTIVIQNQYWDLYIDEDHFEVTLSFNQKKEHLYIPFDALIGFFDPSVDFGLHFYNGDEAEELNEEQQNSETPADSSGDQVSDPAKADNNVVTLDAFRNKGRN